MPLFLIKNEQHTLLRNQEKILIDAGWTPDCVVNIPAEGMSKSEMAECLDTLQALGATPVFLSPVPAMMAMCQGNDCCSAIQFMVFHNDKRVAVESKDPQGRTVVRHTVAQDGWQLV